MGAIWTVVYFLSGGLCSFFRLFYLMGALFFLFLTVSYVFGGGTWVISLVICAVFSLIGYISYRLDNLR